MKFKFNFKKYEKELFIKGLENIERAVRKNAKIAMIQAGEDVESYMKLDMARGTYSGSKTGKVYKRSKKSFHTASRALQSPAVDTGRLIGSIGISQEFQTNKLKVTIGAGGRVVDGVYVDYAKYLEYGTKDMLPRPFMKPAMEEERRKFKKRMETVLRKSMQQAFRAQLK